MSYFPEPFFFSNSQKALSLPLVFAKTPDLSQVKSGSIISSFFGSLAHWREANFPVLFNELPESHAVVFVTNNNRPYFLKDFPLVKAPTIEIINHPSNSFYKLLVIAGRNSHELVSAAQGLAQGTVLLRGQRVELKDVKILAKRKPYDAPYWIDTSIPTSFYQLLQYKEQLLTKGMAPLPIALPFQLPPDLYLGNGVFIPVNLKYRYSQPQAKNASFLTIDLNGQFVKNFLLKDDNSMGSKLTRSLDFSGSSDAEKTFYLASSSLGGAHNKLTFSFDYGVSYGEGTKKGVCKSVSLLDYQAMIDKNSTIDFSHLNHFIAMPNLKVFIDAGYPFTRLADLSETWMVIPKKLTPMILSTIMTLAGHMGAQTGYPVLSLNLSNDWQEAIKKDADLLYIGTMPKGLMDPNT